MSMRAREQVAELVGGDGAEQAGGTGAICTVSFVDAIEEDVTLLAAAVFG